MTRLPSEVETALEALRGVGDVSVQSEFLPDDHFDQLVHNYGELSRAVSWPVGQIRDHYSRSEDLEDHL